MPVAPQLAALVEGVLGAPLPVRIRAWDGSEAGAADGPVAVLRHRRALRRLLWNPGELGLARAFVAGELDVEGDLAEGLSRFWRLAREHGPSGVRPTRSDALAAARLAARFGVLGPRPHPPASEARLGGGLHTRRRDRAAIAHHYDLSNEFYAFLLDPRMAYSCGYWTRPASPSYGLADAQRDKLDLICRKLGLRPGMRLLDVGCGWASLLVHAAQHHGVTAVGVTLSAQQRAFGLARVRELGLDDRVEIRLQDYREIDDPPFDAVASIEMGEHVGEDNYPVYARQLHRLLVPRGRLLLQQMSRGAAGTNSAPGGGAFMERYVAPDMFMRPLGSTLDLLEAAGLEVVDVHALREHYVHTVRPWLDTLQDRRDEAVALVGEEQYRIWRLYLAGAALAFEENRMGVHQVLMVRPDAEGRSGLPRARRDVVGVDPAADHAAAGNGSVRDVLTAAPR
ncbi:cyclopropane-fatty-acyl-phospholipid synthase [Pseudonocardia kunmingensis]|uniref:Cyclopropane-fatty-acyl-phospholipid synthase n=1 Tax=Pseudonocardia kunmingensis TaxID=630975 RepID=A0A543DYP4_9PSEU|nr:cyclopropane-fatty-acyl-phospholipid synthase [Pseudonocardia kunmingensis]